MARPVHLHPGIMLSSKLLQGSLFALTGACLLMPASASAQLYDVPPVGPPPPEDRVQLGAQVGWLFGANVDSVNGDVGLNGNWAYTGNADFRVLPTTLVELRYTYFPTEVEFHPTFGVDEELTDLNVHYMQAGVQGELPTASIARPFLGFSAGASVFDPDNFDSETYFSTMLSGGVKLAAARNVGARLQASLPYTWTGTDSAVFCSFGGCSYGFVGDGILQFDVSAGAYAMF